MTVHWISFHCGKSKTLTARCSPCAVWQTWTTLSDPAHAFYSRFQQGLRVSQYSLFRIASFRLLSISVVDYCYWCVITVSFIWIFTTLVILNQVTKALPVHILDLLEKSNVKNSIKFQERRREGEDRKALLLTHLGACVSSDRVTACSYCFVCPVIVSLFFLLNENF